MTKAELKAALEKSLDDFREETSRLDDSSRAPVAEGELIDFAKQVFYALDSFKNALLMYLD